eukprot:TRINITY_DN16449_c0_g1_i1.p1 TRINITY_DN16449_c0_g1~~TRINITY_DN16449_c0_g1_i1.p1  ORF type:complete len:348 (+),score=17.70 TRINITY_DN16449_c0_g1_i1:79-1122(+)
MALKLLFAAIQASAAARAPLPAGLLLSSDERGRPAAPPPAAVLASRSRRSRPPPALPDSSHPSRPPPGCAFPIAFVHTTKCGGTGMLMSLNACCRAQTLKSFAPPRARWPLAIRADFWHATALEQRYIVGPELWRMAYSFALVRNPWARHVSRFMFLATDVCRGSRRSRKAKNNATEIKERCTKIWLMPPQSVYVTKPVEELGPVEFRLWVRMQSRAWPPGSRHEYHFSDETDRTRDGLFPTQRRATQWSWLADEHGRLLVDEWFRLEELEKRWPYLQKRICGLRSVSYAVHSQRGRGRCAGYVNATDCPHAAREERPYQYYYDGLSKGIIARVMDDDIRHFRYTFN